MESDTNLNHNVTARQIWFQLKVSEAEICGDDEAGHSTRSCVIEAMESMESMEP